MKSDNEQAANPHAGESADEGVQARRKGQQSLHVLTYNIHKGFPQFNRRLSLHDLRERLQAVEPDLVFLQEVVGFHARHAERLANWPTSPQYEFLADQVWDDFAYGRNAVVDDSHHGNAILSKFPISRWDNEDVSAHQLERRGLLHCEIGIPGWTQPLHTINVHLGLFRAWRERQLGALVNRIDRLVPHDAPLIIAGDFNDWTRRASHMLERSLNLSEVFESSGRGPARSFPAMLPMLHLDRIYVRGFRVKIAHVHRGMHWARISDHAPLSALLTRAGQDRAGA
ncbi:MAG: endonuclease/exonuclease/phosphatase family protein [Burkholderiales bacterium]|nr:endonuclease/exonuclease/phosphatase family protein [Burkholderiales bacterium]